MTREVLSSLSSSYFSEYSRSFTESLLQHCSSSEGIVRKESNAEKKLRLGNYRKI